MKERSQKEKMQCAINYVPILMISIAKINQHAIIFFDLLCKILDNFISRQNKHT